METSPPFPHSPAPHQMAGVEVPTVEMVDAIVALTDPVIRNLHITQSYCELSQATSRLVCSAANWCTYATWASKQAGVTIRQEDLVRLFERRLERSPEGTEVISRIATALSREGAGRDTLNGPASLIRLLDPGALFARTSEAVAQGNLKVFAEIGREFARFLATFRDDVAFDAGKIARYGEVFRAGAPPDGQDYLRRALTHLYQARFEPQLKAKAELLLLANLEIGFHEQTRLQPEIAAALDAPVLDPDQLRARILETFLPQPSLSLRLRLFVNGLFGWKSPVDRAAEQLAAHLRLIAHRVITECLMTLALPPDLVLRLGRDVPLEFPEPLRQLSHAELQAMLSRLDPTPDSPRGSGTEDWSDLADRMHYIADLFRAYQEYPHLFNPAFTAAQVLAIKAGQRPDGPL